MSTSASTGTRSPTAAFAGRTPSTQGRIAVMTGRSRPVWGMGMATLGGV